MFQHIGNFAVRFRWPIILFWATLFLITVPFAPRVGSHLKEGFGDAQTESREALDILIEDLGATESVIPLAFFSDTLTVDDPRYGLEMKKVLSTFEEMPEVKGVTTFYNSVSSNLVSDDGRTTLALVYMDLEVDEVLDLFPSLNEQVRLADSSSEELEVWAVGGIAIFSDLNEASERDLRRAEAVSLPLVLVALIIVFGGLVAAGLPVAMGAVSVSISLAGLLLLAQVTDMSIFALNIVSFLGLGVAVDYSLLVVSRFREELARGRGGEGGYPPISSRPAPQRATPQAAGRQQVDEAVLRTIATAGKALLFSGITSVLGLSGLLLFEFMMLRSIGMGGMLVMVVSFLIAITLLPAILSVLGHRVDRLSLVRRRPETEGSGFWRRLASWVMAHPFAVSVPLIVFLALLGTPFLGVKIGAPWASILPPDAESRQRGDILTERMGPGALSPIVVVVQSSQDILSPGSIGALYDFLQPFQEDPRVERVESLVTLSPSLGRADYQALYASREVWPPQARQMVEEFATGGTTVVRIYSNFLPTADETKALVEEIRATPEIDGIRILVTGETAALEDAISVMYSDFPKAVIYVMVAMYLALLVLFRSVVLPLKAVIMNGMSIFASYGALVFIFQQGHFQGLLGFQAEGFIEPTVPILLFAIVFGLSMDYEVFLLSRVKEIYDETGDNAASVAQGLERTGRVITSAAMILVLVAASFATADIVVVKALGLGTAIAVFLDATVVRALLVPALMRIMGNWNWWSPAFLRRVLPGG